MSTSSTNLSIPLPEATDKVTRENYVAALNAIDVGAAKASHNHDETYLNKTNTNEFIPTGDYQPATKKYVDDNAGSGGASAFTDLTDTPSAYTGQGSKVVSVKSDESGLEFVAVPAAENGIPAGGADDQILAKVSSDDYDVVWVDPPTNAESILTKAVNIPNFVGKDGYILAYDETAGEFYLKADEGGGGGLLFSSVSWPSIGSLGDITLYTTSISK